MACVLQKCSSMLQTSSPRTDVIERTLRASQLFSGVQSGLGDFARAAIRKQFRHGDYLWHRGDPAIAITVITSGLVKICQPNRAGESAIVALFGPRESI